MKHTSLTIITGSLLLLSLVSCGQSHQNNASAQTPNTPAASAEPVAPDRSFTNNIDGLEYKVITKGTGTLTPKSGDFCEMHVWFKIGDTVVINTVEMNEGKPVMQQCQPPMMKGDLMEGLMTLKAGDSAVFRMLLDTFAVRAHQPKPSWAKPGDYATWEVKMVQVKTKAQVDAETAAKEKEQKVTDDKSLQAYFKSKGIRNVKKSPNGLYYVVHKPGAGLSPKAGQKVTVNYTGQNLQGEKFDSNVDPSFGHVEPFSFDLGKKNVIRGWDEGVALMKKGMKATFYIPSWMAYGERGAGGKIPPNAILIFDIELLDFK